MSGTCPSSLDCKRCLCGGMLVKFSGHAQLGTDMIHWAPGCCSQSETITADNRVPLSRAVTLLRWPCRSSEGGAMRLIKDRALGRKGCDYMLRG